MLWCMGCSFKAGTSALAACNWEYQWAHCESFFFSVTFLLGSHPNIFLIWQHILEAEIEGFLLWTAHWTSQWFNKLKFHIFLHLPSHICHFGPVILFATEAFESFNAVICAKSIHSNRQAPSWDIGRAFTQGNHMQHLLSGIFFISKESDTQPPSNLTSSIPIP